MMASHPVNYNMYLCIRMAFVPVYAYHNTTINVKEKAAQCVLSFGQKYSCVCIAKNKPPLSKLLRSHQSASSPFSRIALFAFIILTAFTHTQSSSSSLKYRDYYHFSPFTCILPLMLMLFVSYYYFYIESHATALLMHTMDCSGYVFHRRCCKWDVVHKHAYHYPLLFLMKLVLGQQMYIVVMDILCNALINSSLFSISLLQFVGCCVI